MDAPRLYFPIKPLRVNQAWGVLNPAFYSQFGFTRHNGIDMALAPDKKIYAPFDGQIIRVATKENGQWQPNGGGVFVSLLSEPLAFPAFTNTTPDGKVVQFAAGTFRILFDGLHCESVNVTEGQQVTAGTFLAVGDTTGFSTGPHCHSQWRREVEQPLPAPAGISNYRFLAEGFWLADVDSNEANNSFDPTRFFTGIYALDVPTVINSLRQQIASLTAYVAQLWRRR